VRVILPLSRQRDEERRREEDKQAQEMLTRILRAGERVPVRRLYGLLPPKLTLTRDGLQTSQYGFIPWTAIDGVRTITQHVKGVTYHALTLYVPTLNDLRSQMTFVTRLRHSLKWGERRRTLLFTLSGAGRQAKVLGTVAELLWNQNTGRKNMWFADDPRFTQMLREAESAGLAVKAIEPGKTSPEDALLQFQRLHAAGDHLLAWQTARREQARRTERIAIAVILAGLAITFAWLILQYFGVI
jgi:hypothetical protein